MIDFNDENLRLPCPLCKQPSAPTVAGEHMKCLKCAHIWNVDKEPLSFDCFCKGCNPEIVGGKSMEELSKRSKKVKAK